MEHASEGRLAISSDAAAGSFRIDCIMRFQFGTPSHHPFIAGFSLNHPAIGESPWQLPEVTVDASRRAVDASHRFRRVQWLWLQMAGSSPSTQPGYVNYTSFAINMYKHL